MNGVYVATIDDGAVRVQRVVSSLPRPNGIAVFPNRTLAVVSDTRLKQWHVFDTSDEQRWVPRRLLGAVLDEDRDAPGSTDGLEVRSCDRA